MGEHTKGPWFAGVNTTPHGKEIWVIDDYDTPHDIIRCGETGCEDDAEANACLIAAAPDLLDACRKLLRCSLPVDVSGQAWIAEARAAIAKATGATP